MKKYIIILGIMFITVGITVNPAVAIEKHRIYEMGESSQIVSFPMTAEEIADEDANIAQPKALYDSKVSKEGSEAITFELAESGETIEFAVKALGIYIEDVAETTMETEEHAEKPPNS